MLDPSMAGAPAGLSCELIEQARARIAGKVNLTPVLTSATLDELRPARSCYFKCENFQKGGAFKARGATNAVFALSTTPRRNAAWPRTPPAITRRRWRARRACAASLPTS